MDSSSPDFQTPSGKSLDREESIIDNPYLFQGRRWDPESKLYYYRNRYYDSGKGRFITRDPAGLWTSNFAKGNPYTGFDLNSLKYVDFSGLIDYILIGGAWESGKRGDPMVRFKNYLKTQKPNADITYHTWREIEPIMRTIKSEIFEFTSVFRKQGEFKCFKKMVIIGHSWGGRTAYQVSHRIGPSITRNYAITIDLITIDPVSWLFELPFKATKPPAINKWVNIYREESLISSIPNVPIIGTFVRGIIGGIAWLFGYDASNYVSEIPQRWGKTEAADINHETNLEHWKATEMYQDWKQSGTSSP